MQLTDGIEGFDKPTIVSSYFGFVPIRAPRITREDCELVKECEDHIHYDIHDKAAVVRHYLDNQFSSLPHPTAIVYKKPLARRKFGTHSLHFIGTSSGIAEAAIIRTSLSMLQESGYKDLIVNINCMGDRESIGVYERELLNHIRKSNITLTDDLRQSIRNNVFNIFRMEQPDAIKIREILPPSINFLSSQSRAHFKEVLEYIEALGIDFRITPELVGERNHSSHTVFSIKEAREDATDVLAYGYRYSRLGRYFGSRKDIPMAGASIFGVEKENRPEKMYKVLPRPKFYLVQLGREAKIKTLTLIELLRSNHIPVYHLLGKDKITAQLDSAASARVSHLIIIGQKEALDNTATVRNVTTRAQETINISFLPQYLKNISL